MKGQGTGIYFDCYNEVSLYRRLLNQGCNVIPRGNSLTFPLHFTTLIESLKPGGHIEIYRTLP